MKSSTLLQYFHWYYPDGGQLWPELVERVGGLNDIGVNMVWLPPVYEGAPDGYFAGYDFYDLSDLGEFDQRGTVTTEYGDKNQSLAAIDALKHNDIAVLLDMVVNHKIGADKKEKIRIQRVNTESRTQVDDEITECEGWACYTFPARAGQYSRSIWGFECFSDTDHIENPTEDDIFKIVNDCTSEDWDDQADDELGNFDYLMGENIDFRNHAVIEEIRYWACWVMDQTHHDGFRLDAVKHVSARFYREQIGYVQEVTPKPLFIIAEY